MKKLKTIQVYSLKAFGTLSRYTILEVVDENKFWVLHTNFIRSGEVVDTSAFEKLTIERLFDVDLEKVDWCDTVTLAIEAHDREFDDLEL